jgi:prolyl oligopeptidase
MTPNAPDAAGTVPETLPDIEGRDEFLWLEDITGAAPLEWVREHNARTDALLVTPDYSALEGRVLEVLDSTERIPMVTKRGDRYYNFWRDQEHPRGVWRRTDWDSYRSDHPDWEVLLDLDALSAGEGVPWVWAGAALLRPADPKAPYERAMVALSPDGGDAVTYREFSLEDRRFVDPEAGGFVLPTAKTRLSWLDADTLYVGTDFGPGSLTTSSYPRSSRLLRRGGTLTEAELYFEVPPEHLTGSVAHDSTPGFERDLAFDVVDFFSSRTYLRRGEEWVHLEVPDTVNVSLHRQWLLLRPREDWQVGQTLHPGGSLLAIELETFLAGDRNLVQVFLPDARTSLQSWSWTENFLLLNLLADVSSQVRVVEPGTWSDRPLEGCPPLQTVEVSAVDDEDGDDYWQVSSGFLTPSTLSRGTLGQPGAVTGAGAGIGTGATPVRAAPSFFPEDDYEVQQHFAVSLDGTKVPYFQVASRQLVLDGGNPTLLSGYGGFEISRTPAYSGAVGRTWLDRRALVAGMERGGVYVVANIRGGGEYGPGWHRAALQENRHRAYEDFAAVAEDLVRRGVTSRERLGCEGRSNGGLLVGNMLTQYPQLFGAVSCGVPLLDMRRYTKLSAGYSWIAEYGNPDLPEQWEFIRTFSPYHLLQAGTDYPPAFIWTATSDDRVGPVQARKMVARMEDLGVPDVWFYESLEGGHAGASDNRQAARLHTASHEFLWRALTGSLRQPR